MLRQAHAALHAHLPDPGGLEAKLDQPRRHQRRQFRGMVIVRKVLRHLPDDPVPIPPRPLQNLVRGSVEVEAINIGSFDDVTGRRAQGRRGHDFGRLLRQPHARGEVRGPCGSV